jgi:hypothetical protein
MPRTSDELAAERFERYEHLLSYYRRNNAMMESGRPSNDPVLVLGQKMEALLHSAVRSLESQLCETIRQEKEEKERVRRWACWWATLSSVLNTIECIWKALINFKQGRAEAQARTRHVQRHVPDLELGQVRGWSRTCNGSPLPRRRMTEARVLLPGRSGRRSWLQLGLIACAWTRAMCVNLGSDAGNIGLDSDNSSRLCAPSEISTPF